MKGKRIFFESKDFRIQDFQIFERDGKQIISGHAIVFNVVSEYNYGIRWRIKPGAFSKSIKDGDIRALVNHDSTRVLGRRNRKVSTLMLQEDEEGLYFEIDPPRTSYAEDLLECMRRGDIDGVSFGAEIIKAKAVEEGKELIQDVTEMKVFEISIVTFPAFPQAKAKAKYNEGNEGGIDFDFLSGILEKNKEEISDAERNYIKEAVTVLTNFMTVTKEPEPPEPGDHSGEQHTEPDNLTLYERELELLEKGLL